MTSPPRWRRFDEWDTRPLRHDQFAVEDPEAGFATFHSPWDPAPSARDRERPRGRDRRQAGGRVRHPRRLHRGASSRPRRGRRGDGDGPGRGRAHAGRHQRAARKARAAGARHDAGQAGLGRVADVVAGDHLRLFEDAAAPDARQPGACHECQGRSAATRRGCGRRRGARLRRDRDDDAGRVQLLGQRDRLRGRRVGRARRRAVPVLDRGGGGAAHRHGRLHLLCRDRVGLRHRGRLRRRRRHALVEGLPDRGLCLARDQGALHLGRLGGTADGLSRASSRCSISKRAASACNAPWACRARRTAASTARR